MNNNQNNNQNNNNKNNNNNFFNDNPLLAFALFSLMMIMLFKSLGGDSINNNGFSNENS